MSSLGIHISRASYRWVQSTIFHEYLAGPKIASTSTDGLDVIYKWRLQQEHTMKASNGGRGMSDEQVTRWVDRGYNFAPSLTVLDLASSIDLYLGIFSLVRDLCRAPVIMIKCHLGLEMAWRLSWIKTGSLLEKRPSNLRATAKDKRKLLLPIWYQDFWSVYRSVE